MSKITKDKANYRAKGTAAKHCGNCSMFRAGSCTLVKGDISTQAVCDYWERK